jgi:DNA-binding transcriptional LysR family regulator
MHGDLRLSLRLLRAYLAAVDHGSIAAAAAALNVASSAVATAIDKVEAEFATTLVTRTRARGVTPTTAGRLLADRIRALLEDYEAVMSEGHALGSALTGELRIGYYAPVAPAFLPGIVQPLLDAHPGLTAHFRDCDNDSAQAGLLDGTLDVIIFAGGEVRVGIATEVLIEVPPYLLAPAGHAFTLREHASLKDLEGADLVLLDLPLAGAYTRRLFEAANVTPRIVATASTTEMVRSLVGAGVGLAVLNMRPRTAVSYGGDELTTVPLSPAAPGLILMAGYVDGRPRRVVTAFLDALRDWFSGPNADALTVRE